MELDMYVGEHKKPPFLSLYPIRQMLALKAGRVLGSWTDIRMAVPGLPQITEQSQTFRALVLSRYYLTTYMRGLTWIT